MGATSQGSFLSVSTFGFRLGCTATITRCSRPPFADSSWYLLISPVTAVASSSANAARSAAEANLTSPSMANVASRLRALAAPATSCPTSRTSRAASAISHRADKRSGDREESLGDVALPTLLQEVHEPMALQRFEVVVHVLPGQAEPCREHGGGAGLGQFSEEPNPHWIQGDLRRHGVLDHRKFKHGTIVPPTTIFVKTRNPVGHFRASVVAGSAEQPCDRERPLTQMIRRTSSVDGTK